ncbi:hypothetical protein EMCRGX_G013373 [Ephydatia muelleri]|eukprot:Em0004g1039a
MTTLRPFTCSDLLTYNNVNLDPLTETYNLGFYLTYLSRWPEYFYAAEAPSGKMMGYIMGKSEARQNNPRDWHGHVTAISVADEYRRLGLAAVLMKLLEDVSEQKKCYFVDLFVRVSNSVAFSMYKNLGYVVYRTITNYYTGPPDEDAYDMRKALSRDKEKLSEKPCNDPDFPIEAA